MANDFLFTSESVTEGHPDKICDQISDAVLDDCLAKDETSKVACEVMATGNLIIIGGEITTKAQLNLTEIARQVVKDIGYDDASKGLDYRSMDVKSFINQQSSDIAQGVLQGQGLHKEQGAGDQGLMFGYATNESSELMPMPIYLAHLLAESLAKFRKNKDIDYLGPDGKTQVTVEYQNNQPKRIDTVVISSQHTEGITHQRIKQDLIAMARQVLPQNMLDNKTLFHINPTGRFVLGGPGGDCGLTGRKIIVDTYGGMGRHGGGAFSGKDPSKVDRSAAYAARYIAKNIIGAGLARECEVQLSYAIGYHKPISINVNHFGSGMVSESTLADIITSTFPLSPRWIIDTLALNHPIYKATSCYGHFGRKLPGCNWENLDIMDAFKVVAA